MLLRFLGFGLIVVLAGCVTERTQSVPTVSESVLATSSAWNSTATGPLERIGVVSLMGPNLNFDSPLNNSSAPAVLASGQPFDIDGHLTTYIGHAVDAGKRAEFVPLTYSYDDLANVYDFDVDGGELGRAFLAEALPFVSYDQQFYDEDVIDEALAAIAKQHDLQKILLVLRFKKDQTQDGYGLSREGLLAFAVTKAFFHARFILVDPATGEAVHRTRVVVSESVPNAFWDFDDGSLSADEEQALETTIAGLATSSLQGVLRSFELTP